MPYVKTEAVESSNIERIGYLRTQQILRVVFKGGRAYDYPLVTEREYKAFMEADSKGSFFNRRIRPMYGHRIPRPVELVEPCCEHKGSDTCTKECDPCNEFCCPGRVPEASAEEIAAAVKDGLAFGAAIVGAHAAVERTDGEKAAEIAEAYGASPETVKRLADENSGDEVPPAVPRNEDGEIDMAAIPDATELFVDGVQINDGDADVTIETVDEDEQACLHPNVESLEDGSNAVCASCGVDLSQSGDCPHGASGRTCEEGCGCIPCHANVPESPEAEAHSKALNEAREVIENKKEETNGDTPVVDCVACGTDLSQGDDCPHSTTVQSGGIDCAEELETDEKEEEETNGNSD